MMVTRPFGVLKKLLTLRRTAQASRFVALQLRCHDQPVDAQAIQKLNAFFRTQHKRGRRQRIRQHRPGRDYGRARHGIGRLSRCADRECDRAVRAAVRNRRTCTPPGSKRAGDRSASPSCPRMANPDRPRRALRVRSSQIQVAAGIDGEILERLELARGRIDGEALGHRAQVERQRTAAAVMVLRSGSSCTSR